ncbi:MAG: hypothetical protein AB7Q00_08760 [Phycisphaerales bacterium]
MRSTQRVKRLETKAADLLPCPECGNGGRRRGDEKMSIAVVFPGDPRAADNNERCTTCGRQLVIQITCRIAGGR